MARVDLARVVDLAAALDADARAGREDLRTRDRNLGRALAERADDATARVVAWLDARREAEPTTGERALAALGALRALLAVAGGLLGVSTAIAVFAYDGSRPVNVMHVLAVFVGLQVGLIAATLVLMLPDAWRRRVPGLAALQDVLRLASPGRWLPALRRLLPPAQREALDRALALARRQQRLYGDAQKWLLLVVSQGFAVSFHVAALAVAVLLIVFSDLAFGWSTTLTSEATRVHAITAALAAPWSRVWPEAVPSLALVAETQYFRGAGGFTGEAPRSADWWRFLIACMACYGLAPRLTLLGIALARQRAALRDVFAALPGAADLRDRIGSRSVTTVSAGDDVIRERPEPRVRARAPRPARVYAVRWSGLALADDALAELVRAALGSDVAGVIDGGAGADRSDAALIADLAAAADPPAFVVKGWEPPLLELSDLLRELRARLGAGAPIFVLPAALDATALADGRDARIWSRGLDDAGDPWLFVVTAEDAT